MTLNRRISGQSVMLCCDPEVEVHGNLLLDAIESEMIRKGSEAVKHHGTCSVGWSTFVLEAREEGFLVTAPDYEVNALQDRASDLTLALRIQESQLAVCSTLGVDPLDTRFYHKIVISDGVLEMKSLYLERGPVGPGDSGWYIGQLSDHQGEMVALRACEVFRLRRELVPFLCLPVGTMIVIRAGLGTSIFSGEGKCILTLPEEE